MQNKELIQLAADYRDLLLRMTSDVNYTLAEFSKEYIGFITPTHSKSYVRANRTAFRQLINHSGNIYLKQLNIKLIDDFLGLKYSRSPQAAATYYRILKAAFNKAVQWNYILDNPFAKIKTPRVKKSLPVFINESDLLLILQQTKESYLKDLFLLAFHSGLRLSEILSLQWNAVDLQSRIITVKHSENFTTKSKKERIVPINKKLFEVISARYPIEYEINKILGIDNYKTLSDYVFYRIREVKLRTDFVSKKFKRAVRKAGLNHQIHFHTLRHSFASNLVQRGVSLYVIKELLGHSDFRVTQIYSHLQHSNLKIAVEKLTNNKGGEYE